MFCVVQDLPLFDCSLVHFDLSSIYLLFSKLLFDQVFGFDHDIPRLIITLETSVLSVIGNHLPWIIILVKLILVPSSLSSEIGDLLSLHIELLMEVCKGFFRSKINAI